MNQVIVEVSVLTPPKEINVDRPQFYPEKIQIGRDGLIVSLGTKRGLLLPQVPMEWGWDAEEFLTQCCLKAQLSPDAWLFPSIKVYSFNAIIFTEKNPRGAIQQIKLQEN
jgi:uncharacterized protein (TIGR00296 family)